MPNLCQAINLNKWKKFGFFWNKKVINKAFFFLNWEKHINEKKKNSFFLMGFDIFSIKLFIV